MSHKGAPCHMKEQGILGYKRGNAYFKQRQHSMKLSRAPFLSKGHYAILSLSLEASAVQLTQAEMERRPKSCGGMWLAFTHR